jgi:hypothetical protein
MATKSKTAKKAARKAAPRKRRDPLANVEQLIARAVAQALAATVETAPPAVPPTSIRRNRPEPKAAPAKAKAAVLAELPTITAYEKAFIAAVTKAGGITAKQQPWADRINAKLRERGEPTIDLPRRQKGDPTPGQLAKAEVKAKGKQALGRGFADIELTRLVAEALRGAPRGLTMGGLLDALASQPGLSVSGLHGAIGTLVELGVARKAERKGQVVYLAA